MILDSCERGLFYQALHPRFAEAFAFLRREDLGSLADGRHDLDGDRLFALVMSGQGRGRAEARLEVHRRYIDIQAVVDGQDLIGWRAAAACREPPGFDEARDVGFLADPPASWVAVPRGCFAVFWPEDAHAPLAGEGPVRKVVVKVAM